MFTNGYEQNARIAKINVRWRFEKLTISMLDTVNIDDNLEVLVTVLRYSGGLELGRFFRNVCILLWTWPAKGWPILRIRALLKKVNLWPTTVMINYTFSAKTNIMILPPIIGDKYLEAVNIINLTLSSTSWNHKHCHRYHCRVFDYNLSLTNLTDFLFVELKLF